MMKTRFGCIMCSMQRRRPSSSDEHHTHHVHVYQTGHPDIERHLTFRDYLIAHPDRARAYSDLKAAPALEFRDFPASYTSAKDEFVAETLRLADAWKRSR